MTKKELYQRIGNIDEDLIEEAEIMKHTMGKRTHSIHYIPAMAGVAASVAILFAGISLYNSKGMMDGPNNQVVTPEEVVGQEQQNQSQQSHTPNEYSDEYALALNEAIAANDRKIYIEGHFLEQLSREELGSIVMGIATQYEIEATANYSKHEEEVSLFNIDANIHISEQISAKLLIAPNEIASCYVIEGEPMMSSIQGVPVEAGYFDKTNDGSIIYYAKFQLDGIFYYVEMIGGKAEKSALPALLDEIIGGGKADFSILNPDVPEL